MRISKILIEDKIKEKILYKRDIRASEIRGVLTLNPIILRVRDNRYMAIGFDQKFITIIFEMMKDTAFIITAYPSSDAQRKLYKRKKN